MDSSLDLLLLSAPLSVSIVLCLHFPFPFAFALSTWLHRLQTTALWITPLSTADRAETFVMAPQRLFFLFPFGFKMDQSG